MLRPQDTRVGKMQIAESLMPQWESDVGRLAVIVGVLPGVKSGQE